MPELQATVEFSNVQFVESCSVTLAHGITPSQAVLRILPQERSIRTKSDLVLTFGTERIVLRDCLADTASFQFNRSGQAISVTVIDRRWKWRFPTISGRYNTRDHTGDIHKEPEPGKQPDKKFAVSDSERTTRELMELCLKALGETGYTIESFNDELRTEVNWDHENAAQALQAICDTVGARVVLQLNNKIAICNVGIGEPIPVGPVEDYSASLDPPDKPTKLQAFCAPSWFQVDLELEAVGMERDGTVKPIDKLSYKPAAGWTAVDPVLMAQISGDQDRKLALETVFRWYQVVFPAEIPGYKGSPVKWPTQLLLTGSQVFTHKFRDVVLNRKNIVWGTYYFEDAGEQVDEGDLPNVSQFALDLSVVQYPFSIDQGRCLVQFTDPVYGMNSSDQPVQPAIKLRTAVQVRDATTGEWVRYSKDLEMDKKSGTKAREVMQEAIRMDYVAGKERNKAAVDGELKDRLEWIAVEYNTTKLRPESAQYAGWLAVNPDGAIHSVSWSMDQSGATTIVQRNNDRGSATTNPYTINRLNERYAAAVRRTARLDAQRYYPDIERTPAPKTPGSTTG